MSRLVKAGLILIIFLSLVLRVYKLASVPPSLNWDEVAAGYNAYTIANWGRDEWGTYFPLVFKSFADDKHPVHIYITAVVVRLLGSSDFTTRLSGALIGTLSVVAIFFLARRLFKSDLVGIFAALFLAISPYHLHFSRGLWEINFALFFFILGLLFFYKGMEEKGWFLCLSFFSFGVSLLSYHSSKVVVPPIVFLLVVLYLKRLLKKSEYFYIGILIFLCFIGLIFTNKRLAGLARVEQTKFSQEIAEKTQTYQKTGSTILGLGEIVANQYITHFTYDYLFISGDDSPRNSVKVIGEFYKIDAVFILVGLLALLALRSRLFFVLFAWVLLAPLPSSLVSGAPNATRAVFMMGGMHILAALGASTMVNIVKRRSLKIVVFIAIVMLVGGEFLSFIKYYYTEYPKKESIEWQYGMKQIVEYVEPHPEYHTVYMTDIRQQPYIFFLYYLKVPLPEFLKTVEYNETETKSFNTVASFGRYRFGGWDPIESKPGKSILFVVTPSQYDGLRHKSRFIVKEHITYPNGTDAFFLVN